jgi:hypothetical protein
MPKWNTMKTRTMTKTAVFSLFSKMFCIMTRSFSWGGTPVKRAPGSLIEDIQICRPIYNLHFYNMFKEYARRAEKFFLLRTAGAALSRAVKISSPSAGRIGASGAPDSPPQIQETT